MKDQIIEFFGVTEYEELDKWMIVKTTNSLGRPVCQIYNTNVQKLHKAKIAGYYFTSEKARDEYIVNFKESISKKLAWKAERAAQKAAFKNPAKVGDILSANWGYEQTNIDFYQVVDVKGKFVTIRQVAQGKEEGKYYMQGTCMPKKDVFISEPLSRLVKQHYTNRGYLVNINSFAMATLWEGKPEHWTAYA